MPTINRGRIEPGTGDLSFAYTTDAAGVIQVDSSGNTVLESVRMKNTHDDIPGIAFGYEGTNTNVVLLLRSILGEDGARVVVDGDLLRISTSLTGRSDAEGEPVFLRRDGEELIFASVVARNGLSARSENDSIIIDGALLATQAGVGLEKEGTLLSLSASGVTAGSYDLAAITVDTYGRVLEARSGVIGNIGTGEIVYAGHADFTHQFKTFKAGTGVVLDSTSSDITISVPERVRRVDSGIGLTGGPITDVGTIQLADMPADTVKGRLGSDGPPVDLTPTQLMEIVKLADGPGSGLDADTLAGLHASPDAEPISLVSRDGVGGSGFGSLYLSDPSAPDGSAWHDLTVVDGSLVFQIVDGTTGVGSPWLEVSGEAASVDFKIAPTINGVSLQTMTPTGVVPGDYVLTSLTVDAYGRITAASSGEAATIRIDTGPGLTGGPITDVGTIQLADMPANTVKGRLGSSGVPLDLSAAQLVEIIKMADGFGSGLDADLLDGMNAYSTSAPTSIVSRDVQGRSEYRGLILFDKDAPNGYLRHLIGFNNGALAFQVMDEVSGTTASWLEVSRTEGSPSSVDFKLAPTVNGVPIQTLTPTGVVAGTYPAATVTVDNFGRITEISGTDLGEVIQDTVGQMVTATGISVAYDDASGTLALGANEFTITVTGDANGTVTVTDLADATLALSIPAVSALTETIQDTLASSISTSGGISATYDDAAGQLVLGFDLDDVVAPGTYRSVTVNSKGRVISGANPMTLAGFGITDAIPVTQKGAANGVATLDGNGLIPSAQLPPLAITDTFVVASQAAMQALPADVGDVAVRTDLSKTFILKTAGASTPANWQELLSPTDAVVSVNGQTGVVVISNIAGNAATATKLQTARTINGVTFDGSSDITITGATTSTLTAGSYLSGGSFNGSASVTFAVDAASANAVSKLVARDAQGNFSAGTITASLTGNASTATKLQTARSIALTGKVTGTASFDGSADATINTTVTLVQTDVTTALGYTPARTDVVQTFTKQQNTAMVTLTGPVVAWNLDASNTFQITLGADATFQNPTGMVAGGTYMLLIKQNSTGGFTTTWGTAFKFPSGLEIQPAAGSGSASVYSFLCDGTAMYATAVTNY